MPVKGKLPFCRPSYRPRTRTKGQQSFCPTTKAMDPVFFLNLTPFALMKTASLSVFPIFPITTIGTFWATRRKKQPSLTIRPFLQQERKVTMCCSPGPGERENPPWSKPWFPALEKKVCALSKWSEPNWTTCPVFYPSSAKKSTIVLCFFG